jgi:hypothetical protein
MAADPAPASSRDNVVGFALIIGAVLIGLFLLVKGYDAESGVVAQDDPSSEVTTTTTVAAGGETTTTTAAPAARPPAEVAVAVANASGASGLAGQTRTTLQGAGYTQITISDAPTVVPSSQVLYLAGSEADAQAVATALGLDAAAIQVMPDPPPVPLGAATVLVLAGPDLV